MLNLAKNENAKIANIPINLVTFKVVLGFVSQYFTPSHLILTQFIPIPQLAILFHCIYNAEKKERIQVFDEMVKFADRKHICYHTIPLPESYCKHVLYTCCYHIVTALLEYLTILQYW